MRAYDEILKVLNEDAVPPFLFTRKNILLGTPTVSADPVHNTSITVSGIPFKGYNSSKDVLYKRMLLNEAIKYEDDSSLTEDLVHQIDNFSKTEDNHEKDDNA